MKGYYTIPEIANMMEVSYTTVYSWKDKGILVPDKVTPSNRCFFSQEKIHNFINSMNLENSSQGKGVD